MHIDMWEVGGLLLPAKPICSISNETPHGHHLTRYRSSWTRHVVKVFGSFTWRSPHRNMSLFLWETKNKAPTSHQWVYEETSVKNAGGIPATMLKVPRLHLVELTSHGKCRNRNISLADLLIKRNSKIFFDTINSTMSPVVAPVPASSKSDSNDSILFIYF